MPRRSMTPNAMLISSLPRRHIFSEVWVFANRVRFLPFLLIFASVAISLAYTWLFCPLDLASDEAHYWDWSRELDWCYYSKGPLVAWLISGSCELFGSLS